MDLSQAVEIIRPSIVQIGLTAVEVLDARGNGIKQQWLHHLLGTGFLVSSEGHVITANHLIGHGRELITKIQARSKHLLVGLALPNTEKMRGNFTNVVFHVVDTDALHDLALLKLAQNPFKGEVRSGFVIGGKEIQLLFGTVTLNCKRPKDGAAIGISGYPLGLPVLVTNAGHMATVWSFDIQEVPLGGAPPEWYRKTEVADTYLADVQANPGNSGGPAYLADNGTVIGVCIRIRLAPVCNQHGDSASIDQQQLLYSSGLTEVVPAQYVTDLLRKNNVYYSELSD
jgi:S1-C subfamily serine protease